MQETRGRNMGNPIVWVVDDDPSVLRAMRRLVEAMSCDCAVFETGEDLLVRLVTEQPNLIILDIHMPGASGPEVLAEVRARGIEVPVVMITGVKRAGGHDGSTADGALEVLGKPVGAAEVGAILARIGLG
jgi:two-component system nitrogen regulation response regulator GlnG